MKKRHSRLALLISLILHGSLFATVAILLSLHKSEHYAEQESLSMEMVAALLEQPPVAVAPDASVEEVKEVSEPTPEPEPEPEPEAVPDPTLKPKPEKPKDKPKEEKRKEHRHHHHKDDEKPKEKPKERQKDPKPVKAIERGAEVKQGIVAKAITGAAEGEKANAGVVGGQRNGSANATSTGSSNTAGGNPSELAAYKAALQKALQRRANNSYPQREKMMRKTGTVTIKFSVLPSGQITNVSVVSSSGNSNLDAAAMRSAEGLQMPPPPAGFPSQISAPVKFSIE